MVTSVQVIPMLHKTKKEKHRHSDSPDKKKSFAHLLNQAMEDENPINCSAITYGPNSQLNFHYPSKEYTY